MLNKKILLSAFSLQPSAFLIPRMGSPPAGGGKVGLQRQPLALYLS